MLVIAAINFFSKLRKTQEKESQPENVEDQKEESFILLACTLILQRRHHLHH